MVDYQERRRLIRNSLKIQPLSHGQVYTYTVGMRSQPDLSPERYEELRWSLENHKSNLIPIVVRRAEDLGDDQEYEVIYGADWVKVAEDSGIEMLWAWVFDLTDEEAIATQDEMALLLGTSTEAPNGGNSSISPFSLVDISRLLDQKLDSKLTQLATELATQSKAGLATDSATKNQAISALDEKIKDLADKVQILVQKVEALKMQPPARQSKSGALKSIDELKEELKKLRAGDDSVSAEILRSDLGHSKVVKEVLKKLAEDLQLPGYSELPKKITKSDLINFLLTC